MAAFDRSVSNKGPEDSGSSIILFFFFLMLFTSLSLAALGLCCGTQTLCCTQAFSSCCEPGLFSPWGSFYCGARPPELGISSCGAQARLA